jgi:hypothetical protein
MVPLLNCLGRQGADLHEFLITEFSCHRPKDTGAARAVVVADENSGVLVEADIGPVGAAGA